MDFALNAGISETARPFERNLPLMRLYQKQFAPWKVEGRGASHVIKTALPVVVLSILQRKHCLNRNTKQKQIEKSVPANMEYIKDSKNCRHIEIEKK